MIYKFFQSLALGLYFTFWDFFEYLLSIFKYYYRIRFALTDLYLLLIYPLTTAHHVCFSYLKDHPEERVQVWYGETALSSFAKITTEAHITDKDHLFELGCGRGRLVFWASTFLQCKTTGIDINPTFIKRAKKIERWLRWKNTSFLEGNFMDVPLSQASVVYLYGTAFEEPAWPNIIEALLQTKPGARIITVSKTLEEYGDSEHFKCIKTVWVGFVWGKGPVYIHERL